MVDNRIGTDASGFQPLGNGGDGIGASTQNTAICNQINGPQASQRELVISDGTPAGMIVVDRSGLVSGSPTGQRRIQFAVGWHEGWDAVVHAASKFGRIGSGTGCCMNPNVSYPILWPFLTMRTVCLAICAFVLISTIHSLYAAEEGVAVLIVDGQNNHKWEQTTPLIQQTLEGAGIFDVDVVTSPPKGGDMKKFRPNFSNYDVVVSNYNGEPWSEETQHDFEKYVAGGGGFVCVHAADNSFPKWNAYNRMIGLGGWGGRSEKDGPYVRWKEDQKRFTRDLSPGAGGSHGKRVPFMVVVRDSDHPITKGLPSSFMQTNDELYSTLRGPAENMHVLATGFSSPTTGGSGEHEPLLMTIQFGNGRVFHTTLGHDADAIAGVAFQVTLQRGAQWAATGKVTLPAVDSDQLSGEAPSLRDPAGIESDSASTIPDVEGDGWVSLFNGSDLKGWSQKNGTATYRVADGVIIGKTAEGSPNSFLCTEQTFEDFELTFEVKDDPELNSGVQIRSLSKADYKNGRVHGPQIEIETAPGESGYVYSEGTGRSWITTEQPIKDAYQNDQWNRFVVRAKGNRIETWVNGQPIADVRDAESSRSGFIGLQVHGIEKETGPFEVRWRDIRVRH